MASISDISNELIRDEIEEFIERPNERERIVNTFAKARASMQEIGRPSSKARTKSLTSSPPKPSRRASKRSKSWTTD